MMEYGAGTTWAGFTFLLWDEGAVIFKLSGFYCRSKMHAVQLLMAGSQPNGLKKIDHTAPLGPKKDGLTYICTCIQNVHTYIHICNL